MSEQIRSEHFDYLRFNPHLAQARERLPAGTCDCHAHIFEDEARFSYAWPRLYTPPPARVADYQRLRDVYGIDRLVLVHGTVYGADHTSFEYLLSRHGDWMRGVAVVGEAHTDAQLQHWHTLGVRATRINVLLKHGTPPASIPRIVDKVKTFDWHVELLCDLSCDSQTVRSLAERGCKVVVDHMGMAPPQVSIGSRGLSDMLDLMREGRVWVKASAGYRLSDGRRGFTDVRPLVDLLLDAGPTQVVWGTNWPHPLCATRMPNDGDIVDAVFDWFPTPQLRQQVLVDNPRRLYWDDRH